MELYHKGIMLNKGIDRLLLTSEMNIEALICPVTVNRYLNSTN